MHLAASLDLYADVILNPVFPEGDFARLRDLQLASIEQEDITAPGTGDGVIPERRGEVILWRYEGDLFYEVEVPVESDEPTVLAIEYPNRQAVGGQIHR